MNKTRQLRVFALYLSIGLPLAASCAREANTLDDAGPSGSGGTSPTTAGGSTKAGSGNAGNSSAFGGTSSTAGKASGAAGDATAEGGAVASAGAGGSGGSTGVPPDVLERASAIVEYATSHAMASDGKIQMVLHVINQSNDDLPMASVKIRYWFTAEVTPELHQYYTGPQAQLPKAMFVDDGADSHALLTFGGGVIKKGGDINSSEIQLEMTNNTGKFDQSDDFSWDPTSTTRKPNGKITLYLDDKLIWGCEPSGACFDGTGAGGAGGAGSAGGAAGAGGAGGAAGAAELGGAPGAGGAGDAGGAGGVGGAGDAGGAAP